MFVPLEGSCPSIYGLKLTPNGMYAALPNKVTVRRMARIRNPEVLFFIVFFIWLIGIVHGLPPRARQPDADGPDIAGDER